MADERSRPIGRVIPADKARQGDIVLRTPLRRAIFIAGLVGGVLVAIVLVILSYS